MDGLSQEALQYEWLPVNITVTSEVVKNYGILSSTVVYTIIMKRRSVLYVVNFILPTLFFFCLDLASFLILDSGGEKLSFKVTVLLAVTVMQLILNDILPSSSDRIPLIAVYCIGVFGLMMMSLLETILVMYLMQKDKDKHQSLNEDSTEKQGKFQNCFRGFGGRSFGSPAEVKLSQLPLHPDESTVTLKSFFLTLGYWRKILSEPRRPPQGIIPLSAFILWEDLFKGA
nr:5-hydroxytryptamine receptor 3E-like [Labrus bergylta]